MMGTGDRNGKMVTALKLSLGQMPGKLQSRPIPKETQKGAVSSPGMGPPAHRHGNNLTLLSSTERTKPHEAEAVPPALRASGCAGGSSLRDPHLGGGGGGPHYGVSPQDSENPWHENLSDALKLSPKNLHTERWEITQPWESK